MDLLCTLQQLNANPYAQFIYTHCINKPNNWVFRFKQIQFETNLSRGKVREGMRILSQLGYFTYNYIRNATGRITSKSLKFDSKLTNHLKTENGLSGRTITTTTTLNNNTNRDDQNIIKDEQEATNNQQECIMAKKYTKDELLWIECSDKFKQIQAMAGVTSGDDYKLQEFHNFLAYQVENFEHPLDMADLEAKFFRWSGRTRALAYQHDEYAKREQAEAQQTQQAEQEAAEQVHANDIYLDNKFKAVAAESGSNVESLEVGEIFNYFKNWNIAKGYTLKKEEEWLACWSMWLAQEKRKAKIDTLARQNNNRYTNGQTEFKPEQHQNTGYGGKQTMHDVRVANSEFAARLDHDVIGDYKKLMLETNPTQTDELLNFINEKDFSNEKAIFQQLRNRQ